MLSGLLILVAFRSGPPNTDPRAEGRAESISRAMREPGKEDRMATQIVMDHTGDTRHQFDPADAAAVTEAEVRFKKLTRAGFTAAKRLGKGKSEVIRSFDLTAEETLFMPRLQGG